MPLRILVLLFIFTPWALANPLLIKNITLISSQWEKPKSPRDILIDQGQIVAVESSLSSSSAKQVDGSGRFLIPGLIDSHVHLGSYGGIQGSKLSEYRQLVSAFRRQEPLSYLHYGFTTVVDLHQSDDFARTWRERPIAPTLRHCTGLPYANGYGMAFEPQETRLDNPFFLLAMPTSQSLPGNIDPASHTAEAVMKKVSHTDSHCVKTFHESGFSGLWHWPTPPNRVIQRVLRLAHQQGRFHIHHGNTLAAYQQAAEANVDIIAHGLWDWQDYNDQSQLPDAIKRVLDKLQQQGTAMQPTARVLGAELDVLSGERLTDPELANALPAELLEFHRTGGSDWFVHKLKALQQQNPAVIERFLGHKPVGEPGETTRAALRRLSLVLEYWLDIGGTLLLGSDSPSSPTYANPPGLNGYWELKLLHRLGVPLKPLLAAATRNNAQLLGESDSLGIINVGAKADLLLLRASPLKTVEAYHQIDAVIKGGKLYPADKLKAAH